MLNHYPRYLIGTRKLCTLKSCFFTVLHPAVKKDYVFMKIMHLGRHKSQISLIVLASRDAHSN